MEAITCSVRMHLSTTLFSIHVTLGEKEKENTGSKLTHSCLPNLVANRLRDTGMRHTTSME